MTVEPTYLTNGSATELAMTVHPVDREIMTHPNLLWWLRAGQGLLRPNRSTGERTWWSNAHRRVGYVATGGIAVADDAAFAGQPVATFGAGDEVALGDVMPTNGAHFTLFSVFRAANATDGMALIGSAGPPATWFELRINGNVLLVSVHGSTILIGPTFDPTVPHVAAVSMRVVGGNQQFVIELDGAAYGSVASVNDAGHQNNQGAVWLGRLHGYGFQFLGGMADSIGFGDLSDADKATFTARLKSRCGIGA